MEKIEFTTADGTKYRGYQFTWKGLSLGLTKEHTEASNKWGVVELQTGCFVMSKRLATRKEAINQALEVLNDKGAAAVKKRIKEIFTERGNTKAKGKIQTVHFNLPDNMVTALCGRVKGEYCLPVKYFKCAQNPCKKCLKLSQKKKAG